MKRYALLTLAILLFVIAAAPILADPMRENPSLYSYAEIVKKLPAMWLANPIEVLEMMGRYPDYACTRSYDIISCASVNNRYSAAVHITYQFSSEDDYAEFDRAIFSVPINSSEDVQKIIELFWLPGMEAAKIEGAFSSETQLVFYFRTDETLAEYIVYLDENGLPWIIQVDMGLIRG